MRGARQQASAAGAPCAYKGLPELVKEAEGGGSAVDQRQPDKLTEHLQPLELEHDQFLRRISRDVL